MCRNKLLLFTCIALVNAMSAVAQVYSGWHANSWPSDERWQGGLTPTNLWAQYTTAIATNYSGTNVVGIYAQVYASAIVAITNVGNACVTSIDYTNYVLTSMVVDVRELRQLDSNEAALERFGWVDALRNRLTFGTQYFYRKERDNLVTIKQWLNSQFDDDKQPPLYANRQLADENANGFSGVSTGANLWWETLPDLLAYAGAPTNFTHWTPWRALNGAGPQYAGVYTQVFAVVTNALGGPPFTNTVNSLWTNITASITGTNGELVTVVFTNTSILAGYTTEDYGWKHMPAIMEELAWFTSPDARYLAIGPSAYAIEPFTYNPAGGMPGGCANAPAAAVFDYYHPGASTWSLVGVGSVAAGDTYALFGPAFLTPGNPQFVYRPTLKFRVGNASAFASSTVASGSKRVRLSFAMEYPPEAATLQVLKPSNGSDNITAHALMSTGSRKHLDVELSATPTEAGYVVVGQFGI